MKRLASMIVVMFFMGTFFSCATAGNNDDTGNGKSGVATILSLDSFIDKELLGINESEGVLLLFRADGTFDYTKNGVLYNGKWVLAKSAMLTAYNLEWTEESVIKKYLVSITAYDNIDYSFVGSSLEGKSSTLIINFVVK